METIILNAIKNQKLLEFDYDGCYRVVQPHIYGLSAERAKRQISTYQIRGESNTGGLPAWRTFDLDKIENLKVLDEYFSEPAAGYNPRDPKFRKIFSQI